MRGLSQRFTDDLVKGLPAPIRERVLADNALACDVMQEDILKLIARELADRIKAKATLD